MKLTHRRRRRAQEDNLHILLIFTVLVRGNDLVLAALLPLPPLDVELGVVGHVVDLVVVYAAEDLLAPEVPLDLRGGLAEHVDVEVDALAHPHLGQLQVGAVDLRGHCGKSGI